MTGFGIGTNLSNDMGLKPLNIVMKLMSCNGQAVAKLSDSSGKTRGTCNGLGEIHCRAGRRGARVPSRSMIRKEGH